MTQGQDMVKTGSLRFGVMCNGTVFRRWQAEALTRLIDHGHRPALLIVDARETSEKPLFLRLLRKRWGTALFFFIDRRIFSPTEKDPVNLEKELSGVASIRCKVVKRGVSEYFAEDDLNTVRDYRLDFILRFGFGIIRGDILSAAGYGVWSFHHDDEMIYRGGPPGFWEIYRGDPVSGAVMQRLTERLDGGIVLKKGYLKTVMHSWRESHGRLLEVSSAWPALVADELASGAGNGDAGRFSAGAAPSLTVAPLYRVPGNLKMINFLLKIFRNRILFHYRRLMQMEIWNVGMIEKPIHELALGGERLRDEDIRWLPEIRKAGYLADPFGYVAAGRLHVLAEDYSYRSGRAGISEVVFSTHPDGVVEADHHLSYPYVVEHEGEIYCLPESSQAPAITLYRKDKATGQFTPHRTLLVQPGAVDPTLISYHDRWWLFLTTKEHSNTHLYLFYSRDFHGEFLPHRLNPVKIDVRSARPAGTPFSHEGALYRPAQDCSVTYGGRIAVNRVLKLTPDEFLEETVGYIEPPAGSIYRKGIHTISKAGGYTLIDGKRYVISLQHLFRNILRPSRFSKPGRSEPGRSFFPAGKEANDA